MRSRWIVIAIGLLLIAVLAGISVMHLAPEAPHNEPGTPPPPAVSDEIAQAFLNATQADGVANRYAVAEIVNNALQAYYTDHGAYPPYLFGGGAMTGRSFTWMSAENMLRNPDPLISGGYLQEYPRVWYVSGWPRNPGDDGTSDPRGWDHWNCMFSTPGDLLVFSPQCIYLTGQYLLLFGDEPDLEEHADSSPDLRDRSGGTTAALRTGRLAQLWRARLLVLAERRGPSMRGHGVPDR